MRLALQLKNRVLPGAEGYEDNYCFLTGGKMHVPSLLATEFEFIKIIYWLIVAKKHRSILEIGTNEGDATYWFLKAAEEIDGKVVTIDKVDLYKGAESSRLTRSFIGSDDFFKDSREKKFDFIYVDGDHSFLGAFRDMLSAEYCVSSGGTIAIHDVNYDHGDDNMVRSAFEKYMTITRGKWIKLPCGEGLAIGEF